MRLALLLVLLFPRWPASSRRRDAALTAALAFPAVVSVAADVWLRRRRGGSPRGRGR